MFLAYLTRLPVIQMAGSNDRIVNNKLSEKKEEAVMS
jgi:hypothetical protein